MQIQKLVVALIAAALIVSCTGGGSAEALGPEAGSAEWYWDAAVMNVERGDYPKALEHLENAVAGEGEFSERAVVWKTVVTAGLARGHRRVAEACKSGIEAKPESSDSLTGFLQQAQRDARQYTIDLLEGLGEFEKTLADGKLTMDFPFPSGTANESPALMSVSDGDAVPEAQMIDAVDHALRRYQILAVTEMAGADGPSAAQAQFDQGPVTVPAPRARMSVARLLVGISPLLDTQMMNDPKIRKILLDRAEQWVQPQLEGEDEDLKAAAEELMEKIEDERRDMGGTRRRLERG